MIAKCRHFGECGGCSFQDIPYSQQINDKEKILSRITGIEEVNIIKSPRIDNYRNKMEYSFEGSSLGLHPRGRFDKVIDLKECPVFSEWIGDFLQEIRKFASRYSIPYYNRKEKKGILRYLILRESKFTGEIMVILVVDEDRFKYEKEWTDMVKNLLSEISSIVLARRHLSGDSAVTDDYEILEGKEYIRMKSGNIELDLSPYSFFQPNSYQIENMYNWISSRIRKKSIILDLFTGIGAIPFYLSGNAGRITGVEHFESCFKDSQRNLARLKLQGKIEFKKNTVREFLSFVNEDYEYVIIDPPRGGMSHRVWTHLQSFHDKRGSLERIFYICCNLKNLEKDLNFIKNNTGWKIKDLVGVDQFVHTPHLETIVEIEP